jgi:hypothetical protein
VIAAIQSHYPILGGVLLVIALIPLISAMLACGLIRQLGKHRYEQVD